VVDGLGAARDALADAQHRVEHGRGEADQVLEGVASALLVWSELWLRLGHSYPRSWK
jgi:hypothetical protein